MTNSAGAVIIAVVGPDVNHGNCWSKKRSENKSKPYKHVGCLHRNNHTKDEEGMSSAIDRAISAMPDDYLIKAFLEAHRAEVKGMLLTEYNEAEQMALFKEDGRREGRAEGLAEGRAEGIIETLVSLVKDGFLSVKDAAKRAGITEAAFEQKMATK